MATTLTTAQTTALLAMATAQQDSYTATELGATGSTMQALLRRGLVARATGWNSVLAYMQNAEHYTLTTAGREAVAYQLVLNEAAELGVNVSQDFEALYVEAPAGQVWAANNLHSLHAVVDAWSNTKQDSQEALADLWERMLDGLTDGPCEDTTCPDCYPDTPAPAPAPRPVQFPARNPNRFTFWKDDSIERAQLILQHYPDTLDFNGVKLRVDLITVPEPKRTELRELLEPLRKL